MVQFHINNIPEDIWKFILEEQLRLKLHKGCNVTVSSTLAIIIRDYKKCRDKNNFIPEDHE